VSEGPTTCKGADGITWGIAPLSILYDVHGNLAALNAVLEDLRTVGSARFVLGGDYALFGPWPLETIATLKGLADATWIRGNGERWTASAADAPADEVVQGAIRACADALGAELVSELAALPEQALHDDTRFCHASPVSDVRAFLPEPADDERELLAGVTERRLVFGHTHLPLRRVSACGIELINPGSVGMPFDGDRRAAYAILDDDDRIEHRRVPYDHEASAAAVRERFGEVAWTETVARRIASAQF
jgi:diadenosine tetraphosphatase ApaH/serine/threonine PP2A family protein phosphatase